MPDTTSPAATLREAASLLKELSEKATPGPWRTHDTWLNDGGHTATVLSGEGNATDLRAWLPTASAQPWDEKRNVWNDAAYIAAMGPQVGSPLADWLEVTAKDADATLNYDRPEGPCCAEPPACHGHDSVWFCDRCGGELSVECHCWDGALAVARAVLDGAR